MKNRLPTHLSTLTTCLFALTSFCSLNTPVYAGSMGVASNPWAGAYVGGYLGGAFGNSNINTDAGSFITSVSYFSSNLNINSVNQSGSAKVNPDAFIGGIQAGNNWTSDHVLYGLVADFGSFNLKGSTNATNIQYPTNLGQFYSLSTSVNSEWLFTARARLGYVPDSSRFMVYGTGGMALTELKVVNSFVDASNPIGKTTGTSHSNKIRWVAGAGAEFMLTQSITLNAEYLYTAFNTVATSSIASGSFRSSTIRTSADLNANLLKIGLNYKFA